jgi:acyl-CoA thioesterase
MPDSNVRSRLEAAIDQLDEAQQQRLLDWAGAISSHLPNARAPGASIGPLAEILGITNDGAKDGRARYHLSVAPSVLNPHGVLHGGAVYVMVDYSMGGATMSVLPPGDICATIEIKMSYLASVRGGTLTADTQIIKQGRRIVFLESKVTDEAGKLVATATGSFAVIPASDRA